VLFNEPKLLKWRCGTDRTSTRISGFSALQRAEIAEIWLNHAQPVKTACFSALQRAEIAEIPGDAEPYVAMVSFSALQRAEIAEIVDVVRYGERAYEFQCSSTSRNC